jgi:hypothetical protein
MAGLTARLAVGFWFAGRRLGVRMLPRGGQRRILRRLAEPLLKLGHAPREYGDLLGQRRHVREQRTNDRLRLRRLASNHLFRNDRNNRRRHAPNVA